MSASNLLAYCRAGFERECAQEITAHARDRGVEGFVKARPGSAFALFHPHDEVEGLAFARRLDAAAFVFPRQLIRCGATLADLPVGDRVSPIVQAIASLGTAFREVFLETPDTNDGKALASLIRPLEPHLRRSLAKAGIATEDAPDTHGIAHVP